MAEKNENEGLAEVLKVTVCTPDGIRTETACSHVVVPGEEGDMMVLPKHCGTVVPLRTGVLEVHHPNNVEYLSVAGGSMSVEDDAVTISAYAAEAGEEIDVDRALRAKERAERAIESEEEGRRIHLAKAALYRALTRLEVHDLTRGKD